MALNGIDVSNWKADFDPMRVDFDFLVVQCTWGAGEFTGNGIVNSVWAGADAKIQATIAKGRQFGYMHYIRGAGAAEQEARFFADHTAGYLRKGFPSVDWEAGDNAAYGNIGYLDAFLARYIALTGVPPFVYYSGSDAGRVLPVLRRHDCAAWPAAYGDMNATGYQSTPWGEDRYGGVIRQYSSSGRLPGYAGALDLDIFYGDAATLRMYIDPSGRTPAPDPAPAPARDLNSLADAVIRGEYGDGDTRRRRLGPDYDAVQAIVNRKTTSTASSPTYTVRRGDTLSDIAAKHGTTYQSLARLNDIADPDRIQAGQTLKVPSGTAQNMPRTYTIRSGDTLSAIASAYGTTWQALAAKNRITNPNLIYPGQTIRI
ncbi:MAG: LysM peptidoglycan-binding domain-containing protein [Bifidobacterium sp.]|jgi:LysM repeat protein